MTVAELEDAIARGLRFLAQRQLPSGQFPIDVTYHYLDGSPTELDESIFATTHVIYSLGFLPHPVAQEMIARALTFLKAEMTRHGLWRFWTRAAKRGNTSAYPFIPVDLDDTACASMLLERYGIEFPDNRPLLLQNRSHDGRFYTWFVLRPASKLNGKRDLQYWRSMLAEFTLPRYTLFWKVTEAGYHDIDGVVNANVLLYLGKRPETQPIVTWLRQIVESGQEATCDKWYRDPFTFYYALSRNCHAGIEELNCLQDRIVAGLSETAHENGQIGEEPLHTALAANTLLNFGVCSPLLDNAVLSLLDSQQEAGNWPSGKYYYGGPQKSVSWGSEDLTTGLCLEALQRYVDRITADGPQQVAPALDALDRC